MTILPMDTPSPDSLRRLREELGLSQSDLSRELGFGQNGPDVVRAWEAGMRNGQPCTPTPLAWRCFRMMVVARRTLDIDDAHQGVVFLRENLPECLK